MKFGKTGEFTHVLDRARLLSDLVLTKSHALGLWNTIRTKGSVFLPFLVILALAAGILLGAASDGLSSVVNSSAEGFIDGYSYGAPLLIFLVLAPVLSRIFWTRRRGKFGFYVVTWLAGTKILALLWAVLFTVVVFGLPLLPENSVSVGGALIQTSRSLLSTLTESQFFWAIYAAVAAGLIAIKVKPLADFLEKGVTAVEYLGQYLQPVIPLFMFAVGVYIQSIPQQLENDLGMEGAITGLHDLSILGFQIDPNSTAGMVTAYIAGSLLVAVACFGWHFAILALAKYRSKLFSVKGYFKNYWVKAYPLLWSTSSESLATPLNLYLLSRHAPWVRPTVRRIVVGAGSVRWTQDFGQVAKTGSCS